MVDHNTRLYTEDGECVGTISELLDYMYAAFEEKVGTKLKTVRESLFAVSEDSECPIEYLRYRDGCAKCHRRPYCNSYEKDEES